MTQPHIHRNRLFQLLNDQDTVSIVIQNVGSGELSLGIQGGARLKVASRQRIDILSYGSKPYWKASSELTDFITDGIVEVPATQEESEESSFVPVEDSGFIPAPPNAVVGDLLTYSGSEWIRLPAGATPGHVLTTGGAGVIPSYQAGTGGGIPAPPANKGDILFFDGSDWVVLPAGAVGTVLTSNGPGMDPSYQAGGGGGSLDTITLGTPTDGSFADGLLPFQPTDLGVDAIDAINEVLLAIAPTNPGDLSGLSLTLSGTTIFAGKLPSGLAAAFNPYTPGETANVIYDNTYTLTSPNQTTRFGDGLNTNPEGTVVAVVDGIGTDVRPISSGVGVTGIIEITDVDNAYNGIYRKVNARFNITQNEGRDTYAMRHIPDGGVGTNETAATNLVYDATATAPSFALAPSANVTTEINRFLSGISYYAEGTEIDVSYTASPGIFQNAYHPTAVATVDMPSASSQSRNPGAVPAVLDSFADTASFTLAASNVADNSPQSDVTIRKPNGVNATANVPLAKGVNTWSSGGSSDTLDRFVDELRRFELGTTTVWNSFLALADGNAQVQNGVLIHGADGDYGVHSSDAVYERRMGNSPISGGTLEWGGITAAQIATYNTGDLNVLIHLEDEDIWFDLGLDFGLSNGTGAGDSPANSLGARINNVGSDLVFSFGTFSTGNNSNRFRLQITFIGSNGLAISQVELV